VEIIPGLLFLGNASHSCDSNALQKYNIKVSPGDFIQLNDLLTYLIYLFSMC